MTSLQKLLDDARQTHGPHRNQLQDPQWDTAVEDLFARVDRMLREDALRIMGPHTD